MRLFDYVRRAARRTPRALAVSGPDGRLTYGELDALADRQAAGLHAAGVRPGDRVVLQSGKSVEAVALVQAALRLGAAYVPVTEANPPARVAAIAADCAAALVVAPSNRVHPIVEAAARRRRALPATTFAALAEGGAGGSAPPPYAGTPDELAYVLYTSGSTGTPKGVCISHRNAAAFIQWAVELLAIGPADRLSNHAAFNFDLSVFDLYAAFHAGASVHLVAAELAFAPTQLATFLRQERITIWYSVPSAATLMIRDGRLLDGPCPPDLRVCIVAGEVMPIRAARELRKAWPQVRLFNWYGPTETNVCTSYEVGDADLTRDGPLPIGTAASGDTVLLDPDGDEGEIVVSGPTVMLGYWGQPPHRGPYRTGDIGRRGADGNLMYVGRRDDMIKVRGHRIEPAEIEAALETHPGAAAAAVVAVGSGLAVVLHAVVVAATGASRPTLLDLKRTCAEQLPTSMVVDRVHFVSQLPLTPNGKTNRLALIAAIEGETYDR